MEDQETQTSGFSPEAKQIARDFAQLRFTVREEIMLGDLAQTLKLQRELVRSHHRKLCEADIPAKEEGMNISVAHDTHHHYPPVVVPTNGAAKKPASPQRPAMPWWIKTGIAAALLASGGSLGVGVASYLAGSDTDTDTRYELRLGGEKELTE